ncbi:vWA domain-containing protein [Oleiharenicola lentus]|uniref:vWA domain-containing protein n=1 Tax=Oleiharenicola lentus TaxID=2508720 RepID=UPI003F676102
MKLIALSSLFAAGLIGAASLFAKSASNEPVRVVIDVDRETLGANITERAVIKIGLDGIKLPRRESRPPVNLALVIDRSGSMAGDKIAQAREAALEAVRQLAPDDIVALIAYDTSVQTLVPAQRVGDGRGLEYAIRSLEARGNTALYGGVTRGADEIRKHIEDARYINRVILLSDGMANVGPSSPDELGRLGASLMKEGITVSTIGLGLGFNEDLMARLASRSDGNTYFVQNSDDLPSIFARELGDVLNVVARRVVVEIEFPEGVRPINFVGRDGVIRGQRAELSLSQIYGGQQKFALIEVEVSPGKNGREREIASAKISYENALTQQSASISAKRNVKFSEKSEVVVASANHQVQADYAANSLAVAKEKAIELVDAGRRDEAGALLKARAQEFKSMADTYSNTAVASAAAVAAPEAERVARDGLDNAQRKAYRAESSQVKSQQATGSR